MMLKNIGVFLAAALLGAYVTSGLTRADDGAGGMPQGPMPVSVAVVAQKEVTDWKEFSGRLRADEDVEIRPRVSGAVEAVHFREGDLVEKGSKLFTIDLRPFRAAAARAEAGLAAAKAQSSLTWSELKRAKSLLAEKALSQREFDEKNNAHAAATAAVKSAEAQRDLALLDLEYAEVQAPIAGRVGQVDITVGNMVQAGASVLTTMQSVTPVLAEFDIDEQTYLKLIKTVRDGRMGEMRVLMALADEEEFARAGRIRSFDNQLREDSGTLRVRAEFDNPDGLLTPGLFVRIRLGSVDAKTATVIHDSAIGTNQTVRFVYVVDEEGNVAFRPVTLGEVNGTERIISQGLAPGEKIVVNGLMRVHPGMKVAPVPVSMETLQPLGAPPSQPSAPPADIPAVPESPDEMPPPEDQMRDGAAQEGKTPEGR